MCQWEFVAGHLIVIMTHEKESIFGESYNCHIQFTNSKQLSWERKWHSTTSLKIWSARSVKTCQFFNKNVWVLFEIKLSVRFKESNLIGI